MGTCCSRQMRNAEFNDRQLSNSGIGKIPGSTNTLIDRYTPDPNRLNTVLRGTPQQVDIIRTPNDIIAIRGKIVVALYNYIAREAGDMGFSKGDQLEIIDDSDNDWCQARHVLSGQMGYVPRTYVAEERSVEIEEWFFGTISRRDAETLLLQEENPRGTFLMRNSEQNPGAFSLSIKDWDPDKNYHVKHYKVKPMDNGGFYVTTKQTFPSLQELVGAYSKNSHGLCHILSRACPKPRPHMWDLSPETRDNWEINRNDLELKRLLGSGNFGEVWFGRWKNSMDVAIKKLKPGSMSAEAFMQEAAIMKKFRHPNLVTLFGVCTDSEPLYIVTEFMCQGSLLEFLRSNEGRRMDLNDLIGITVQVAAGMVHLEQKQLIHRDLAARNVLVGEKNVAKICDFGLARVIKDDEYCPQQSSRFPVKWTAPEAILYGRFSIKSDVWSFGILLMEVYTFGQVPYAGMSNRDVMDRVQHGFRMAKPSSLPSNVPKSMSVFPDAVYRLALQCWDADPDKRPTFEFLHHYFDDFSSASEGSYREVSD